MIDALIASLGAVEHIETHISHVLLAGEFAYKLKKPVDLGFVDFTTLEKRRVACEDEVRLNRRLAPGLYLGVVAVTADGRLDGVGAPIDYAVKMRRFPQERLASRMLAQGAFGTAEIDRLAATIARFHAGLPPAGAEWGTPASVRALALDNFRELAQHGIDTGTLARWIEDQCDRLAALMHERHAHGAIRECHGDLHLDNIVVLEGEPIPFDCIEFNPALSRIDVASEIAFVAMDLEARGRRELARRFTNAYLEHTGDYVALRLLPFYKVYRAMVRAKVLAIRAAQGDAQASDGCRRYLGLAARDAAPHRPAIVLTHGFSGSGKTTRSQALVERFGAIRIRADVERKRLHAVSTLAATGAAVAAGIYSPAANAATYDRLAALAAQIVAAGYPVIVDATFLRRADRERFQTLAAKLGVRFTIVDFRATEATLRARVATRRGDASEAGIAVLESQLRTAEKIGDDEHQHVFAFDTEHDSDDALVAALS